MSDHCHNCSRRNPRYDRLRFRLRHTNYVLVELVDSEIPRIVRRQEQRLDDADSGISSLFRRRSGDVTDDTNKNIGGLRTEIIDHFIRKLDNISSRLESVMSRSSTEDKEQDPDDVSKKVKKSSTELTQHLFNNNSFFDRLDELDRRVAEALGHWQQFHDCWLF